MQGSRESHGPGFSQDVIGSNIFIPIVRRFTKGVYELRPTFHKHKEIWNVKRKQDCAAALTLKDLTLKVTFLLLLLSGQRCKTIII